MGQLRIPDLGPQTDQGAAAPPPPKRSPDRAVAPVRDGVVQRRPGEQLVASKVKVDPRLQPPARAARNGGQATPTPFDGHPALDRVSQDWSRWAAKGRNLATSAEVLLGRQPGTGSVSSEQTRALLDELTARGVVGGPGAHNIQEASANLQRQLLRQGFDIGTPDAKLGGQALRALEQRRVESDPRTPNPTLTMPRPFVPDQSRLLLTGDSLADGLTGSFRRIAEANGTSFHDATKIGSHFNQWAPGGSQYQRLDAELRRVPPPTHVVISLGTNDGLDNRSAASIRNDMTAIANRIREAKAQPIFLLPPMMRADREQRVGPARETVLQQARTLGAGIFDTRMMQVPMEPDGIHPRLYDGWAGRVWRGMLTQRS